MIDSNVLVAAAGDRHQHYEPSAAIIATAADRAYVTARHCLAEFYNVATVRYILDADPLPPAAAVQAIDAFVDAMEVLDMTTDQQLIAIRRFAALGGVGARIYDFLIGQVAVFHSIPLIVTWNVRHFAPLFPTLRIATPATILEES